MPWYWPVQSTRITQFPHAGHWAYDVGIPQGTAVMAPTSGVIQETRPDRGRQSYGNLVVLRTDSGEQVYLAHLSAFGVRPGQRVQAGQVVGLSGNTGHSTGPHLHIEVRSREGRVVQPNAYFSNPPTRSSPIQPVVPPAAPGPQLSSSPTTPVQLARVARTLVRSAAQHPQEAAVAAGVAARQTVSAAGPQLAQTAAQPVQLARVTRTVVRSAAQHPQQVAAVAGAAARQTARAALAASPVGIGLQALKQLVDWKRMLVGVMGGALVLIGAASISGQAGRTVAKYTPNVPVQIINRLGGPKEAAKETAGLIHPVAGLAVALVAGKSKGQRKAAAREGVKRSVAALRPKKKGD